MRAMLMAFASVLLCIGLFGCDRKPEAPAAAPVLAQAPAPAMPPQAVPPQTSAPAAHRRHRRHEWSDSASAESYASDSSYASQSSSSESSDTVREYGGDEQSADSGGETEAEVWVDGYGRSHYVSAGASADENPARLTAEDRHNRSSVWRGYNSKCAERGE